MYTIKFLVGDFDKRDNILSILSERLIKDGRFRATLTPGAICVGSKMSPTIFVKPVRLVKKKRYCGNHPNFCENPNRPKPLSTFLEWSDWVAFHRVVNTILNKYRINADVWSNPPEVKGKMMIRKGTKARKRYDWTEDYSSGRRVQTWNAGDETQF
jgi:hypothetical protein